MLSGPSQSTPGRTLPDNRIVLRDGGQCVRASGARGIHVQLRFKQVPSQCRVILVGAIPLSPEDGDLRPAEGFVRLGERSDLQGISLNGSGAGHAHVFQRLFLFLGLGRAG